MSFLAKINDIVEHKVKKYGAQFRTFAIFGLINYPVALIYEFINKEDVTTGSVLRLIAALLCFILLFKDKLPKNIKQYIPIYWYFTIMFSLPTITTYLLIHDNFSLSYLINFNIGVMILMLLVDWLSFLVIEVIGIALGTLIFLYTGHSVDYFSMESHFILFFYMFIHIILCCVVFTRNKEIYNDYLQKAKDELNLSLEQKVQERTKELEAALAAKTEFLNNVSHEIRTPVQGFVNMSQAAYEDWGSFSDQEKHELLEKVFISASRLGSMVCSLLDLAKFSQGKMIMFPSDCELKKIIKEVIEECKFLYLTDKKIDIIFDFDGSIPLHVDKERITQLLRNLLFNAIKFSDDNTKIVIKLLPSELTYEDGSVKKSVHCIVTDEGKGVPENELEAIFEPFTQSTRTNTKAGGTGLGLAIAREIATSHHGKIWAENNKDVGSSFHFIIPLSLNKEEGEKTTTSYQDGKPEINGYILLVDDESYVLNMLEIMLAFGNYKTLKAQNAKEGLALLKEYQDQIILVMLDYMMPGMDGLGFLKRKNADEELKKIPVIFQSGTNEEKVLNEAWEMGIASFLPKPYSRAKVLEEVGKVLKG